MAGRPRWSAARWGARAGAGAGAGTIPSRSGNLRNEHEHGPTGRCRCGRRPGALRGRRPAGPPASWARGRRRPRAAEGSREGAGPGDAEGAGKEGGSSLLATLLRFAGPALLIPLADPIQSLVDTACIGRFGTTVELAALGPNNYLFNFFNYLFLGLGTAATTLVASTLAGNEGETKPGEVVVFALAGALLLGAMNLVTLNCATGSILRLVGADGALVPLCTAYAKIRSFASPAVLACMVLQGALLADKDSKTPFCAVAAALTINVVLDYVLIKHAGWGLGGAAIATVVAQFVQLFIVGVGVARSPSWRLAEAVPHLNTVKKFLKSFVMLTGVYLLKNACYAVITLRTASLPVVSLAAHQV